MEEDIRSLCNPGDFFVIACDKGFSYATNQNVSCNLVIGDFDSYIGDIPEQALILPHEKDDTDTMFAIKTAIDRGMESILLVCASGGRIDHFYSNLQSLVYAAKRGVRAVLKDGKNTVTVLVNEELSFARKENTFLSVLSWSDVSEGVKIKGTLYEVEDAILENGFPLGQSNEWVSDQALVSVSKGILLVIESRQ